MTAAEWAMLEDGSGGKLVLVLDDVDENVARVEFGCDERESVLVSRAVVVTRGHIQRRHKEEMSRVRNRINTESFLTVAEVRIALACVNVDDQ